MEDRVTRWHGRHRKLRRFARDDSLFLFAFNIVRRRRQLCWTQAKLARRLGVPVSVICALEIAQLSFTLAALEEMSERLGLSPSKLLSPIPVRLRRVATRALLRRGWRGGHSPGWQYSPCTPRAVLLSEPRPVKGGWRHGPAIPQEPRSTVERENTDVKSSNAIRLTAIRGRLRTDSASYFVYLRRPISLDELSEVNWAGVRVESLLLPFQRDRHRFALHAMPTLFTPVKDEVESYGNQEP